jgi:hypothetical protein
MVNTDARTDLDISQHGIIDRSLLALEEANISSANDHSEENVNESSDESDFNQSLQFLMSMIYQCH